MTKTLRKIHSDLNLKQGLKIYVRNTNNKYNTDFTADEELSSTMYLLIKFNTLGKQRYHEEQFNLMEDYLYLKRENAMYKTANESQAKRLETAVKVMEKEDLKDRYIEHLQKQTEFLAIGDTWNWSERTAKVVGEYLENKGLKYYRHMYRKGIEKWFNDRRTWFEEQLEK